MSVHHAEIRRIVGRQESGGQGRLAVEAGQIGQGVEARLVGDGRKCFSRARPDFDVWDNQELSDPAALCDPLPADQDADVGLAGLVVATETVADLVEDLVVVTRRVVALKGVEQTGGNCSLLESRITAPAASEC
jgi:hypothetical protein